MCNDSNVTLNITPGKKYKTHIHDHNNVFRYFKFILKINTYICFYCKYNDFLTNSFLQRTYLLYRYKILNEIKLLI